MRAGRGEIMKRSSVHSLLRFCLTALLCSGGPLPLAVAAEGGLEEIVVTAQRREQTLQEAAVAVTAVSQERLQTDQINNLEDLQFIVLRVYFGNAVNMEKVMM